MGIYLPISFVEENNFWHSATEEAVPLLAFCIWVVFSALRPLTSSKNAVFCDKYEGC